MAAFWPTADRDPASTAPMAEFAGIWRDMPKVVYSRTLERADWNATVVRDVVPDEVDEWRIYVHPVILGAGRQLFPVPGDRHALRLAGTRTFGNGVVLLRHQRGDD
jgi:hypothetical protein